MKYEKIITTEQEKVLKTNILDIQEYFDNAIDEKIRRLTDKIVEKSGKGSKFTEKTEKEKIINDLISENSELLKSAEQKNIENEIEFQKTL